jgi:hypothetical protein
MAEPENVHVSTIDAAPNEKSEIVNCAVSITVRVLVYLPHQMYRPSKAAKELLYEPAIVMNEGFKVKNTTTGPPNAGSRNNMSDANTAFRNVVPVGVGSENAVEAKSLPLTRNIALIPPPLGSSHKN